MGDELVLQKSEVEQLLKMAIEKDLDIDKLKVLMDLRDRDERFRAEKEFEQHFAEMQKDYIPAYKSKSVETNTGKTAYLYCPLPLILQIYAPILAKYSFSYRWEESEIEGKSEKLITCFLSGYGFSRSASISLPYGQTNQLVNPIQARGATSEYGRRYTFMNVTGCIVADDTDSDGRIANSPKPDQSVNPSHKQTDDRGSKTCPECGAAAIIVGKPEYGGGWVCYKAKGGCGTKFLDEGLTKKKVKEEPIENPKPYSSKLPSEARSQLIDMMDEMKWDSKRQALVLQKAELVGAEKALDGVQKAFENFCSAKAAEVAEKLNSEPTSQKAEEHDVSF